MRRDEGRLAVSVRLADQRNGHYRWADRFEPDGSPGALVGHLASIIEAEVERAEIADQRERPESDAAPDLYRRAQLHMRTALPEEYAAASALLERALAQDADNKLYLSAMCEAIGHRISMGWAPLSNADAERMHACATHGLRQPAVDADALALFGFGLFRTGDPDGGYALMRRAAELNPNSAASVRLAGQAAMNWGSLEDAEGYFERVLRLDPQHFAQASVMSGMSRIRMAAGDFEGALRWAGRAHLANRNFGGTHWTLIAANAMLGRDEEAARAFKRFRLGHPDVTIARIRAGQPSRARLSATIEGLDRAGLERGC